MTDTNVANDQMKKTNDIEKMNHLVKLLQGYMNDINYFIENYNEENINNFNDLTSQMDFKHYRL
jgi:hypothetical protein